MISSKDLVLFINPPKYLSVLIAYTVAADVLPIFEKHFPKDLRPRKAVEASKMYLDGYAVDSATAVNAANAAANAAYAANYKNINFGKLVDDATNMSMFL